MTKKKRPEWVPKNATDAFTTSVNKGRESIHDGMPGTSRITTYKNEHIHRRKLLTTDDYVQGVLNHDRTIMARAITLIESNALRHLTQSQEVLRALMPHTGKSIRVGITGVPGAGKSTFIEALGMDLLAQGHKLAVLAIDPTSSLTRGSVLGDKTRMEELSRQKNCFIRPSPSGGTLGGVTRKTRETMLLCEAAGFDIIFVETVGVGQNEVTVRSMVDFFLLLKIAGAGDELQGIKKGVIELADAILINKADGDNVARAELAKNEFARALHYLSSPTEGWRPEVHTCSALRHEHIDNIWNVVTRFVDTVQKNNVFLRRRKEQQLSWMHDMIQEHMLSVFYNNGVIKKQLPRIENDVLAGNVPTTAAVQKLIKLFEDNSY